MSLKRIFAFLLATALGLLLGVGASLYFVTEWQARENAARTVQATAQIGANHLKQLMALIGGTVEQLAADPYWAEVLDGGNADAIRAAEERLTRAVPGAALVRLLPGNTTAPDTARPPRMGFADLELVRQAKDGNPPPAVHAANTQDAHIALARRLAGGNGAILASLPQKLLADALPSLAGGGALDLRQDTLSLKFQGDAGLKSRAPGGAVAVPGTPWKLHYWPPASAGTEPLWYFLAPAVAALGIGTGVFLIYRWLMKSIRHDQESLVNLVHDLLTGGMQSSYPTRIVELQDLAGQLVKMKRLTWKTAPEVPAAPPPPSFADERPPEPAAAQAKPAGPAVPPDIFRAYDIRGVVGATLTPDTVRLIGRAIGSEARGQGEETLLIARDGRLSSLELCAALSQGLLESGCSIIDLGLAPTPVLYFATHALHCPSGVVVTGSHNPPDYNGLKVVVAGTTLAEQDIQKLRARIERNDFTSGRGSSEARDIIPEYLDRVVDDTHVGRPLKLVVDCGNGVAGKLAPELFRRLDCEVVELFCEVDGNFPNHHPDPSQPDNLAALVQAVRREGADLGLAFDGDGDRLGVVDSAGRIIWPDRQMMLFAADVLSRNPGADVLFDVKCTRHLPGWIVRHGGRPLMWKTGHSLLKAKLRETGALLAGELSGHIFFKERWYGFDDGLYAAARLVEILSIDPRPSAEVFAELPDSLNTPELHIVLPEGESFELVRAIRGLANFPEARLTDIDGLRVDFADGFGLVRASNTTPSLMARFEADTPEALARIQGQFKSLISKVKPGIALPF
jgi:phosphomannomutase/phosphoglucomutase